MTGLVFSTGARIGFTTAGVILGVLLTAGLLRRQADTWINRWDNRR